MLAPLELLDPIWDALYGGWELLEEVRNACHTADVDEPPPTLEGIEQVLERLAAPDPAQLALSRLAFLTGPERSSVQCTAIRERAREALTATEEGAEAAGFLPLVELIDAVAADADYELIESRLQSCQQGLDPALSAIIAPAMQGRLSLPGPTDPDVRDLLADAAEGGGPPGADAEEGPVPPAGSTEPAPEVAADTVTEPEEPPIIAPEIVAPAAPAAAVPPEPAPPPTPHPHRPGTANSPHRHPLPLCPPSLHRHRRRLRCPSRRQRRRRPPNPSRLPQPPVTSEKMNRRSRT